MNDQELFDNFFNACLLYAEEKGSPVTDPNNFCKLSDDGTGNITIKEWNHDSKQPSKGQLKQYTSQQAQQRGKQKQSQKIITDSAILSLTTDERNTLSPKNGVVIYNVTDKQLQIYIDSWRNVLLA